MYLPMIGDTKAFVWEGRVAAFSNDTNRHHLQSDCVSLSSAAAYSHLMQLETSVTPVSYCQKTHQIPVILSFGQGLASHGVEAKV